MNFVRGIRTAYLPRVVCYVMLLGSGVFLCSGQLGGRPRRLKRRRKNLSVAFPSWRGKAWSGYVVCCWSYASFIVYRLSCSKVKATVYWKVGTQASSTVKFRGKSRILPLVCNCGISAWGTNMYLDGRSRGWFQLYSCGRGWGVV
jgi:hypothetical protein